MGLFHPFALLILLPFLLLLVCMKKLERKRYLDIPTSLIVRRVGLVKNIVKKSGLVLWFLSALFLVLAYSDPRGVISEEKVFVEGRKIIVVGDLSLSMSSKTRSTTGRSSMDVFKELALKFVEKRVATDLVGVTAYAGRSRGRDNGEAAVIFFPTSDLAQLKASINILKPLMLGSHTAIGDGILVSVFSLLDYEILKTIDTRELSKSLDTEDKLYAQEVVKKVGRLNNCMIILFTDGVNNSGIEPKNALWLARMLGIKIHFAALKSTGPTGYSSFEEEQKIKQGLIEGVIVTGGIYSEMDLIEKVEDFFNEVDRLETARMALASYEREKRYRDIPLIIAAFLIIAGFALENVFPRIQ